VAKKSATRKKTKKKKKTAKKKTAKKAGFRKRAAPKPEPRPPKDRGRPGTRRRARAAQVVQGLKQLYPDANCALDHRDGFQLLIATILSAQSTDATVNTVTPGLFARFPDAASLAEADLPEVERLIHKSGFFRQKAKNIVGAARRITDVYAGQVPQTIEGLISLPGVARKTANVVLGTWFGINEGVVVDTHVGRIATRLDLTWTSRDTKDAVKIEKDLVALLPREDWTYFSHAVILHGRETCKARKPLCGACALAPDCPSAGLFE
jgi:endonuclease-3